VAGAGDVNSDGYDDVIVGAPYYDAGEDNEGAAFLFLGSASGVADGNSTSAATMFQSDQAHAYLGRSVAGAGDVNGDGYDDVIMGADYFDAGEYHGGAAFVFLGSASGIPGGNPGTAALRIASGQAGAALGRSVAGAGDVNGDGYDDIIVGAPGFDTYYRRDSQCEGAAFVLLGSASGVAPGASRGAVTPILSTQWSTQLGESVAGAGDVNGDGYDDVIVGAPSYDAGEDDEGAAFVFLGSKSGIRARKLSKAAARLESNQRYARLGASVAGAGDVNSDGYDDVIVGAPLYDGGEEDEGAAFVFLGGNSGTRGRKASKATAAARLESGQSHAKLGSSVAGAGDVNGDGCDDAIVGAPGYDAGEENEGAAFLFLGSASGIADGDPSTAWLRLEADRTGAALGSSAGGAGDVNGDGIGDLIVGAPQSGWDHGAAFVYLGGDFACDDGEDNDADGFIDWNGGPLGEPTDAGCADAFDVSE
jgi:hypothetical protein